MAVKEGKVLCRWLKGRKLWQMQFVLSRLDVEVDVEVGLSMKNQPDRIGKDEKRIEDL